MTVSNLGVCFGPTLLRPEEETVASIMDLKFYNVVVEILITHYEKIFNSEPDKEREKASPQQASGYNNSSGHISPSEHLNNVHYGGGGGGGVDVQDVHFAWRQNARHYVQQQQPQPYTCVSVFVNFFIPCFAIFFNIPYLKY